MKENIVLFRNNIKHYMYSLPYSSSSKFLKDYTLKYLLKIKEFNVDLDNSKLSCDIKMFCDHNDINSKSPIIATCYYENNNFYIEFKNASHNDKLETILMNLKNLNYLGALNSYNERLK